MPQRFRRRPRRNGGEYAPTIEAVQREMARTRRMREKKRRDDRLMLAVVIALVLGALSFHFCFDVVIARGSGMSPGILGGSVVLCVKQSLLNELRGIIPESVRHPGRDSLVLLEQPPDENGRGGTLMIRRVTGVGGDTLDLAAGQLIRNQETVVGDAGQTDWVYPVNVPAGQLFVTGDHRGVAIDSRLRAFGLAQEADVVGRPLAVIWPVYAIGPVK